ncbi:unnamed protein product [Parajaminaea phylloscopi]
MSGAGTPSLMPLTDLALQDLFSVLGPVDVDVEPRRMAPQKLLLLQPSMPSSHSHGSLPNNTDVASKSQRKVSGSQHGPLGHYGPRPQRADSVRRSRAVSTSSTLQTSVPGGLLLQVPLGNPPIAQGADSLPSSLAASPDFGAAAQRSLHSRVAGRLPLPTSEVNYLFPLPPSKDETADKGYTVSGLGLDIDDHLSHLLCRRPSSDAETCPSESLVDSYDSDGLTGSQGWSPESSAYDAGSLFGSPVADSTFSPPICVKPLSISKSSSADGTAPCGEEPVEPVFSEQHSPWTGRGLSHGPAEQEKVQRLRNSLVLLDFEDDLSLTVLGESQLVSLDFIDTRQNDDGAEAGDEESLYLGASAPLHLHPLGGYLPEIGDSWSESHCVSAENESCLASPRQEWASCAPPMPSVRSRRPPAVKVNPADCKVPMEAELSPASVSSATFASPILSGILAAEVPLRNAHAEPASPATASSSASSGRSEAEASLIPAEVSPDMAALRRDFGTYTPLIDVTNDPCVAGPRETCTAHVFSPPLSDEELGTLCTPRPLDNLPSPPVHSTVFGTVLVDSRHGIMTSFDMVNTASQEGYHGIHSALQSTADDVQTSQSADPTDGCSEAPVQSVLARGRPFPSSISANSFLGGQRGEHARLARARGVSITVDSCKTEVEGTKDPEQQPRVPPRGTSMSYAEESAQTKKEQAIRRREQDKSSQFAARNSRELSLPTALVPAHPSTVGKIPVEHPIGVIFTSREGDRPAQSAADKGSRVAFDDDKAVRPRTMSQRARQALQTELAEQKIARPVAFVGRRRPDSEATRSSAQLSIVPSHKSILKLEADTKAVSGREQETAHGERDDQIHPSRLVQEIRPFHCPTPPATVPRIVFSTKRAMPQVENSSATPHAEPETPRKKAEPIAAAAPIRASHSMPTLFIARTPSQRRRGDTGIPETQPDVIAAARMIGSGRRGGILKFTAAKGLKKARWSEVKALRGGHDDIPSGLVLVIEETSQDIIEI